MIHQNVYPTSTHQNRVVKVYPLRKESYLTIQSLDCRLWLRIEKKRHSNNNVVHESYIGNLTSKCTKTSNDSCCNLHNTGHCIQYTAIGHIKKYVSNTYGPFSKNQRVKVYYMYPTTCSSSFEALMLHLISWGNISHNSKFGLPVMFEDCKQEAEHCCAQKLQQKPKSPSTQRTTRI